MKTKTIEQFERDCLAVIQSYQSDLYQDIEIIKSGKASLFFAYDCGSHAIVLRDFAEYPQEGEQVKYLFGTADRWHLLNETGAILECESVKNAPIVHYFDGHKIRQITHEKAARIVEDYKFRMSSKFIYSSKAA